MDIGIRKFAKISDPVEAVQFTGGEENAKGIVEWVVQNDRGARWEPGHEGWKSSDGKNDVPEILEHISLRTPRGFKDVFASDWIVRDADNSFRSFKAADFKDLYVTV